MFKKAFLSVVGVGLIALGALAPSVSVAAGYDVANIQVNIESADAVKARDQAIMRAQRIGFAQLVGQKEEDLQKISDADIARLVNGFSVRNERSVGRSYKADFTVRFEPIKTQSFMDRNGWTLAERDETAAIVADQTPVAAEAPLLQTIVILPVLDIGSRRVVWDDPNPWREAWQKQDHSTAHVKVVLPLADASDVIDIPDAGFLSEKGKANIVNFLSRYNAKEVYVLVAKNQGAALDPSGGMAVSLYKHDGKQLTFVRKNIIRPRPGYVFDDAVPAGMQMVLQECGLLPSSPPADQTATAEKEVSTTNTTIGPTADVAVTVPYQTLAQWVRIQQSLRHVTGVKNVLPIRVSPSSAQVQLATDVPTEALVRNMADRGFNLQTMPTGEMVLTER